MSANARINSNSWLVIPLSEQSKLSICHTENNSGHNQKNQNATNFIGNQNHQIEGSTPSETINQASKSVSPIQTSATVQ